MAQRIPDEVWQWFCKVLLPALAAVTISVATQMKNKTANWLTTSTSVIIGVCMAYITGFYIVDNFSAHTSPIIIAVVTLSSEKISNWVLFKANYDQIGDAILKSIKSKFK